MGNLKHLVGKFSRRRLQLATACAIAVAIWAAPRAALGWADGEFEHRPLYAYPLSHGRDDIIGNLITYKIRSGDTLLDVGRWFGLTATEVSAANNHLDWWAPPVGKSIILPDEHILPAGPRTGIVVNVPELRLYYYYPSSRRSRRGKELVHATHTEARVVYTFPVGLGRYDWRTPLGKVFRVTAKEHNPSWVVPKDIYAEHMERDGYAEHMIPGGDPDNPEGHWRLDLNLPEYAIHGTNNPWGVGMEVSHGCIRLFPEDIDRLWHLVPVGTTGHIVYQPIKFGWRGDALYVEVHPDIYNRYPGLWAHAVMMVRQLRLQSDIDYLKLQKAVEAKSGVPTYVMPGPPPDGSAG
jgi:L,D-transpeptidase ErfK/SrfK